MGEKEQMLAGLPYHANLGGLPREREMCQRKLHQYNNLPPDRWPERSNLMRMILGKTGTQIEVLPPFSCDYGYNIEVGENFYANFNLTVLDAAKVTIGDNCFIGPNVGIYTAGHPLKAEHRNEGWEYAKPITIGNSVWIGGSVTILPGVTIGDEAVIGAGSVVTHDIPERVVAAGNPCRVLHSVDDACKE